MVGIFYPLLLSIAFLCPQSQGLLRYSFVPLSNYPKAVTSDRNLRLSLGNYGNPTSGNEFSEVESNKASFHTGAFNRGYLTRNGHRSLEVTASKRTLHGLYRGNSRTVLYSSLKHLESQWDNSGGSGVYGNPQPINLFHSVLCGSCGTLDSPELLAGEQSVAVKEKIPIVLLHGLLGSARNFQSWMKLVQQREAQIDSEEIKIKRETQSGSTSAPSVVTRDIICMDLRNHGRTAVQYGSKEMDFELMARDLLHTLKNLGLTDVHLVGHSLGGKVAAVAALQLAELNVKEEEALEKQRAGGNGQDKDSDGESAVGFSGPKLKVLSLTLIDVSPVDYEADEAFADVLRTLDIVEDLNGHLSDLGQSQEDRDASDSNSRSGHDGSVANVRVLLNSLLSDRVPDPMLKAFLMASIQPKEEKILGTGFQSLSPAVRALMQRVQASRDRLRLTQGQDGTSAVSEGSSVTSALLGKDTDANAGQSVPVPVPLSGGFEWKFSVEGISGFRNKVCGWPSRYSTHSRDDSTPLIPYLEPVLLMKGANSKFVRSSHIPSISSMFPSFTLLTVRDAGHWLHFEKPNESSESLIRFIRKVEERERGTTGS